MTRHPHLRTRIKICGVRRPADAVFAATAGADAIGIVCYAEASRYVPPEVAHQIVRVLPPFVTSVALFVDSSAADVASAQAVIGAACVQLHGRELPSMVRQVRTAVIKAVKVDRSTIVAELDNWRRSIREGGLEHLQGFVLETAGPGVGGTGVANDWAYVRQLTEGGAFEGLPPIIAAGGLTPETVGDVVRTIGPWAVDVSSGVEQTRGEKSPQLVDAFIDAVRKAEGSDRSSD